MSKIRSAQARRRKCSWCPSRAAHTRRSGCTPRNAAAACANLIDGRNLLEQAMYVDEISPDSAHLLHEAASRAWRPLLARMLRLADKRVARDAVKENEAQRQSRVRFGVYFYAEDGKDKEPE